MSTRSPRPSTSSPEPSQQHQATPWAPAHGCFTRPELYRVKNKASNCENLGLAAQARADAVWTALHWWVYSSSRSAVWRSSCLRLADGKGGSSVRPIGLSVLEYLEGRCNEEQSAEDYVFPGWEEETPFGAFPRQWTNLLKDTELADITPNVLRHSFASIGSDLGFTEATIAALVGHSRGTITSRYIHTVDTVLIMAADSIAGYIQGLLDRVAVDFRREVTRVFH